ncbi:Carboxypeptidase regulatory-like domain-containing protein [Granulicella pectinivorans]|uniref:Carboxypeptidase regulatory-like domain-containing protein n=1 Tax=Granulicella pectinivorans TaxID=474950 RepID=A0A1I6LKI3_9BACT|nr:carboxypeptidase-like regulatory domain-containing protein [Granulicella pectinivorans]SFS03979.1 Carboxypeptidase regulatory-like domain-containing protein [Granulicella pectinivorans]
MVDIFLNQVRRTSRWVVVALVACLFTAGAVAQVAGAGNIQGTVTDATGAVIPGATVVATEASTHVAHTAVTDAVGVYTFPNLVVGSYSISITATGFQGYTSTGNVLEVGSSISINAKMTVGAADQKVEVHSEGLALQTEDVSFKQTVDSQTLTEMPLNGRQMAALITLSGGSSPAPAGDFTGSKYSYQTIAVSIAGSGGNTTQWKLDGGDNNDYMANGNLPFPFPDAVSQFSVESTALGAGEGEHSGGLVNVVTRSGTNKFHGSAFEFLRNNYLNANNFFSATKDSLHQNQYGGTFGGPIKRDKIFAFAGYQRTQSKSSQSSVTAFVPSAANLAGDFSQSDDPTKVPLVNPLTGAPLPNNQINPSLFNPQALALVKYLPQTTAANGQVSYAIPLQTSDNSFVTRVDYTINAKNNLYARYFIDGYQLPAFYSPTNILITTQSGNLQRVQSFTLGEDFAISSKTVNSAHVTLSRRRNNRGYAPNAINATTLGVNAFQAVPNGLYVTVANKFTLGGGGNSVSHFNDNFLAIEDLVTMLRGKHQIVIGGELVHNQLNISNAYNGNGIFTFGGALNYSANGPTGVGGKTAVDNNLDFLMGAMNSFEQSKQQQNALRGNIPSIYVQDTFHATKQLTINAGIRWAPEFMPVDYFNRGTTFDQTAFLAGTTSSVYPNSPAGTFYYGDKGVPRQFTKNSPWQFTPNFGMAYDLTGDGKTVIRAGASYIYDQVNYFTGQRNQQNPPFATDIKQIPTATSGPIPFSAPWSAGTLTSSPFPQPAVPTPATALFYAQSQYIVLPTQYHPSVTMQWTASVQHQFSRGWQLQVDYIGNKTTHVPLGLPLSPAVYVPGVWGANNTGCPGVVTTGPAGKNGVAGTNCSTLANSAQRYKLTQLNPLVGNQYGGGNSSAIVGDGGTGNYHGLITTVQHRLSSTFSLLANHTWSKCLNNADANGDLAGSSVENPNNPGMDYGPCGSDYRHIENLVLVTRSKFSIANRALAYAVNGWELGPLVHIQSGSVINVTSGVDTSLTAVTLDRPNRIAGVNPYLPGPIRSGIGITSTAGLQAARGSLNPAAFCSAITATCPGGPAPGTFGNVSRNAFRGRSSYQFDAQLSRTFPIHESVNTVLRLEAFNVLNHPNLSNPGSSVASTTFGQVTAASAARIFQASAKVNF